VTNECCETPSFLLVDGERVYSVLHASAGVPRGGFLFCHPLGEEKLWAHRVFVDFARRLARAGWAVLRVDFRGEGDSDRPFAGTDFQTRIRDASEALAVLRNGLPPGARVGLLGLRFGCAIAATVAAQPGSGVDRLVLWDPVVKGAPYMQSLLMVNLAFQMALHRKVIEDRKALVDKMRRGDTVNIEGYALSFSLFEQACEVDLAKSMGRFAGRGLVVQIGPEGAPVRKEFQELLAQCDRLQLAQAAEEPFWRELKNYYQRADRLAAVTQRWIEETA
jgi:uncharacterized protein